MDPKSVVVQYLDEAHAMETALATTLRAHMAMAPDGSYRSLLQKHLKETQDQVEAIERRRAELGDNGGRGAVAAGAGIVRDVIGQALVLTKGPLDAVRARGAAERMLKNAKDECATEALEIATYDALEAAAKGIGDEPTARLARDHRAEEERMLAALRQEIPRLALAAIEDRTDGAAVQEAPKTTRKTTSRSPSGRTRSSSSSPSKKATSKAASAKGQKKSTSSSRSKSTRARSS